MSILRRGVAAWPVAVLAVFVGVALGALSAGAADERKAAPAGVAKPALTVTAVRPQAAQLGLGLTANGNVAAWQEASVGTEANGLRLAEVRVNVGDVVKRGQVLATFAADTVNAELAQIRASVAEAEANAADARANAERARSLEASGALSQVQINQYVTAAQVAKARLAAQRAAASAQRLRVAQTRVLAPDDGIISSRTATVGAVLPAGQELFRLIRKGRLEWRAEVAAADLGTVRPGMRALVTGVSGGTVAGQVRTIAPTVDPQTRTGLVYVDLPSAAAQRAALKAGMYARGEFDLGRREALTVPQQAVVVRDGFSYVFRLLPDSRVAQVKIEAGRRDGDRIEVVSGLAPDAMLVGSGAGFLNDGDLVRVVAPAPPGAASAPAAPARRGAPQNGQTP